MPGEGTRRAKDSDMARATRHAVLGVVAEKHQGRLVPYQGGKRRLGDLREEKALLIPEDVKSMREHFGGGNEARGRALARAILNLRCWKCGCRVTYVDSKSPHFAAQFAGEEHGPDCRREPSEDSGSGQSGSKATKRGTRYIIGWQRADVSRAAVKQHHGSRSMEKPAGVDHDPHRYLDSTTRMLIEAINGSVPPNSTVVLEGVEYLLVRADDLRPPENGAAAIMQDGTAVAVFGHLSTATWNGDKGFLSLKARGFQIWAVRGVPTHVLGLPHNVEPAAAPEISTPVPFMVFGRLERKKQVHVVRLEHSRLLVTLEPLRAPALPEQQSDPHSKQPATPASPRRSVEQAHEPPRPVQTAGVLAARPAAPVLKPRHVRGESIVSRVRTLWSRLINALKRHAKLV